MYTDIAINTKSTEVAHLSIEASHKWLVYLQKEL